MSYRTPVEFAIIALFGAIPLIAADPTADLLGARSVSNFIRLTALPDTAQAQKMIIAGTPDSFDDNTFHSVDGRTFAASGEISVVISNFNPLTQVWTVKGKTSVDPNYQAIKLFLDDLKPLRDAFSPENKAGGGGVADVAAAAATKDDCNELRAAIQKANTALNTPGLTAENLKNFVEEANGLQGAKAAKRDLESAMATIAAGNKSAREALQNIREFASRDGKQPTKKCPAVGGDILVDYVDLAGRAEKAIADKEALARSIADLIKTSLDPYLDSRRWRGRPGSDASGLTDFVFTTLTPTFEKQITVTASVKSKSLDLTDNSITVKTADSEATADFLLRRDSFWVPERAAAVIYNRLTYPIYGTRKEADGTTLTVQRTDDTQPVGGAIMLNLIPRLAREAAVYPMLQIGVSSAKDFPGFLTGLGLRFTAPVAFSISAGGMITRYKDLDRNLHVGNVVSGTDEINKHLQYRTSPIVPYGAIQVKF